MLVVLLQQIHGVHGHTFLRAAQEKRARVYSACDTPRHHAHVGVVRTQVCTRSVPILPSLVPTMLGSASSLSQCS